MSIFQLVLVLLLFSTFIQLAGWKAATKSDAQTYKLKGPTCTSALSHQARPRWHFQWRRNSSYFIILITWPHKRCVRLKAAQSRVWSCGQRQNKRAPGVFTGKVAFACWEVRTSPECCCTSLPGVCFPLWRNTLQRNETKKKKKTPDCL